MSGFRKRCDICAGSNQVRDVAELPERGDLARWVTRLCLACACRYAAPRGRWVKK